MLEQALGTHPTDHSAAVEWQRLADDATRSQSTSPSPRSRGTASQGNTPRLIDHPGRCAVGGALANIDVTTPTALVADIHE